ncbi:hypothetical protein RFI_24204 [Reticulomyxa filosa]|uniref:Reverse transcriptase/retrotransposon-derived protein RNase H-like domain-containing protein n=1 Tax=Reticulomyxa filosa TaxID=46433 RepID=X6MJC5_RETFI|nr:hypothetical protein RFI_24204 [Reticulomyxa filosa]|eukprot:ETO13170.1 hypothetical protein RFI_24204 [Reticulomyxa filosa]
MDSKFNCNNLNIQLPNYQDNNTKQNIGIISNPKVKSGMDKLIIDNQKVTSKNAFDIGQIPGVKMKLELKNLKKLIKYKLCPLSKHTRKRLSDKLLETKRNLFWIHKRTRHVQCIISSIFGDIDDIDVYIDDILVATETDEKHLESFLGQVISSKVVSANTEYINKVLIIQKPMTKKQLERLLELIQWIVRFIPNIAALINVCNNKYTLLRHPNQNECFIVQCDSSNDAIGTALLQKQDGILINIEFISKQFNFHQLN